MRSICIQYELPGTLGTCRIDVHDDLAQPVFDALSELAGRKIAGVALSLSAADMKDIWRDDVAKGKTVLGLDAYLAELDPKGLA